MNDYYNPDDLERFAEVGKTRSDLFRKFSDWYNAALEPGTLSRREKVLIGLAVAHALQCPYCIDSFTQACLEEGMHLDHITETVHVASAVRGGASLVHGIQARNCVDRLSL